MKFVAIVFVMTLASVAFAEEGEMLAKVKEHSLSNIDKRITYLQEMKSCVSSAADKAAMKKCHEEHKTKVGALKDENETFRDGMREERKARRKK